VPYELLMDTSATHHVVCDRSFLTKFGPMPEKCRFAHAELSVEAAGRGTMLLYKHEGRTQQLKDVLHVPSFDTNLISVSQADAHGTLHSGGRGAMEMRDGSGTVLL
jgi:hypothetical protein